MNAASMSSTIPTYVCALRSNLQCQYQILVLDGRFVMLTKKSLFQLRLVLLRVASQTTMAFSHCYTSLESFLKAKWHMIRPSKTRTISTDIYEIRPRADKRGVDLISDALPFSPVWYAGSNAVSNAIGYAKFYSRSHDAVIRVYDEAGNMINPVGVI
jgi:hypothetical protein